MTGAGGGAGGGDWAERRRADAGAQAERLARAAAAESAAATALLTAFVAEATAAGSAVPAPAPLRARGYSGRRSYRTSLHGWYLRRDHSCAVGRDGRFYLLTTPDSWAGALRGVDVAPSDPPLVLGRGSRDGDSIALADALARLLAGDPP